MAIKRKLRRTLAGPSPKAVEAFRIALPLHKRYMADIAGRRRLPDDDRATLIEACRTLDAELGIRLWEESPLTVDGTAPDEGHTCPESWHRAKALRRQLLAESGSAAPSASGSAAPSAS